VEILIVALVKDGQGISKDAKSSTLQDEIQHADLPPLLFLLVELPSYNRQDAVHHLEDIFRKFIREITVRNIAWLPKP
jgi:hypothetical protein